MATPERPTSAARSVAGGRLGSHRRSARTLADLPWARCAVRWRLHVRRFSCANGANTRLYVAANGNIGLGTAAPDAGVAVVHGDQTVLLRGYGVRKLGAPPRGGTRRAPLAPGGVVLTEDGRPGPRDVSAPPFLPEEPIRCALPCSPR